MLHLCEDRAVIGTLFYVMAALDGRVVHDSSIPGATPAERAAMYDAMNDVLARLHRVDWRAVGLGDFGKPGNYFGRQIARWTRAWHASKTREIPELDLLVEWLPQHVPADDETTIVHGDFRLGNLMFHPDRAAGDRAARLGALDARPPARRPRLQLPALALDPGDVLRHRRPRPRGARHPSRDDYVARYCARTGRAEGITNFHLAFACFRFAVIFEGIAKRAQIGTAAGADAEQVGRLSVDYARRGWALAQA